jgi:hypothetical protein
VYSNDARGRRAMAQVTKSSLLLFLWLLTECLPHVYFAIDHESGVL